MAPLPCSSFMMCVRTQPIAWKVPVQMTYQNLVMYRKCFMHCDILIYSYSSVSISQCNFGDSPRANFLFTGFIVQFAFYHCWLAPSPLLASIRSFHVIRVQSVFQCFEAALKQYDITIFITNMLKLRYWKIRMQYKKKDISVNDVGFRFRNIKSNVFSHEAWRFNIVYCILVMVWFGSFIGELGECLHRSDWMAYTFALVLKIPTSTLAYLTKSHFMHHRFESK